MSSESVEVRAQWPGRVDEVHVTVGQAVSQGDPLVTLESMKMLTEIESPASGRLSALHVAVDGFVEEGALLAEIVVG